MSNYIDLHNHILPAIDDGPRTMNESVMVARAFVAAGYNTVVATPHTHGGKPEPALILERVARLNKELARQKISLKILPGAEQHLEPGIITLLEEGKILTLNNSRYLLLELPFFDPLPGYTEELITELAGLGYRPIIPHPERTMALQREPQLLWRLYELGALFQLTWAAPSGLLGPAERKTAMIMLKHNLAHLFATDAHNFARRLMDIKALAALLEREQGKGTAKLYLRTRPYRVINDQTLDIPNP